MVIEGELTLGGEHNVAQNCTPGTHAILLTNVIPINLKEKERYGDLHFKHAHLHVWEIKMMDM